VRFRNKPVECCNCTGPHGACVRAVELATATRLVTGAKGFVVVVVVVVRDFGILRLVVVVVVGSRC